MARRWMSPSVLGTQGTLTPSPSRCADGGPSRRVLLDASHVRKREALLKCCALHVLVPQLLSVAGWPGYLMPRSVLAEVI